MPRTAVCAGRDEQVIRLCAVLVRVGRDKGKGALGGEECAGHAAIVRGYGIAVLLVFHYAPFRQQTVERFFQLLFGGFGQGAADIVHAHGLREQRKQPAFQFGL